MGLNLGRHHLVTAVQMKVIVDHVLTDEWQTARELYPKFTKEMEQRTNIEPVLGHNFLVHLRKLCEEGKVESMDRQDQTRWKTNCIKPTKLFRRKNNG